jgi:DNA invertase Pin-like site-specific DNA recombinase
MADSRSKAQRCAIYTRKSTNDGLEQEFNSLDAQREACEAFVASQKHARWQALPTKYDDGGVSGATMDRTALQRLLDHIRARKVDVVVVYKVDRLTRSLADFAKLVELFDTRGVSFVSVTQQFNTTTSMGRLTLNVLLSFAQFEREVTAERIRDKIAASKKKGLWMGGLPPLGYDIKNKRLIVNETEAGTVRALYRLYLDLGTVKRLKLEADRRQLVTKRRVRADKCTGGGKPFTRGHLYQLLSNPIYAGDIAHRGKRYPGQHDAIVDKGTWEAVQDRLASQAAGRRSAKNVKAPSLLTGLIYDETGDRLCPTHASKNGRRYRYYVSQRLIQDAQSHTDGWRLPAKALEQGVARAIRTFLEDPLRLTAALNIHELVPGRIESVLRSAAKLAQDLSAQETEQNGERLRALVYRITVSRSAIRIEIRSAALQSLVMGSPNPATDAPADIITVEAPIAIKRRGVEAKLILQPHGSLNPDPDHRLIRAVARAHVWFTQLAKGEVTSLRDIARRGDLNPGDVSRTLPLAFLAPDIVVAILEGRQPPDVTTERLKRLPHLPYAWDRQRRLLDFAA